ncbi:MAG: J domain-containing protein [Candidatus Sericytochromatia bacterium]|nr:J domain-containing protein [Candidatus Tanganyikabacteria bacterium]
MPRGGYRGGKPPAKSITGEPARLVSFRFAAETLIQLETLAANYGLTRTGLLERLVAHAPPTPELAPQTSEVDALRVALTASQQGRQKLSIQLSEATERELAYQAEIEELRARLDSLRKGGRSWAAGVLHLEDDLSPDAVGRAFRELSKRFHPDLNPDDPEAVRYFRAIVQARDLLLSEGHTEP